jgi:hypothetical protein
MDLLLPVLLAVFPNMLPSTFDDQHVRQAQQERRQAAQLLMAGHLRQGLRRAAGERPHPALAALLDKVRPGCLCGAVSCSRC